MNVFVLNTGRCGSVTFIKACNHIGNYSSGHESRCNLVGDPRLDYPDNHIEADNRLSWLLGRLDKKYGDEAIYVHMHRDVNAVASSFVRRYSKGIIKAYKRGVLLRLSEDVEPIDVALDYCETVNSNIDLFLKDKTRKIAFQLEYAKEDFVKFWNFIGAEGDIAAALAEFDTPYNASDVEKDDEVLAVFPWLKKIFKGKTKSPSR